MASKYLLRKFRKDFENGCEFWTGEDGDLMALVITRRPDWFEVLQSRFAPSAVFYHARGHVWDKSRGQEQFAYRINPNREWPDSFPGQRKVWQCDVQPTDFPVIYYPLFD